MSNNAQFTLHTHPRDKRVAVFDKDSQTVYIPVSWYNKCLGLGKPNDTDQMFFPILTDFMKANAPQVFVDGNEKLHVCLLIDMIEAHPMDHWLLDLESTVSGFIVHCAGSNDYRFALENTKTHEFVIPYKLYCKEFKSPTNLVSEDKMTKEISSFLDANLMFLDREHLRSPFYSLDFMLTKFPKDKWFLSLKAMQEEKLCSKKNPHYDIVYPEDLFQLIRHPRDGRICVENKLSHVKLFPVKWFKKCLNLPRGRNALFSNHTTNQVRHFLAENAPEIFEGKKPWNMPTFTLEDMLVLYPKDKWLLELSGEELLPSPLDFSSIEEDVLLEEEKPKKIQKKKKKKEKKNKPQKTIIPSAPFKKRQRQEEEGDSLRSLAKKWKQECVDRNLEHWKQEFIAEHKAQWRQEYERSHQDDWNKEGQEFARREVVEFFMSKIKE